MEKINPDKQLWEYVNNKFRGTLNKGSLTLYCCLYLIEQTQCKPVTMSLQEMSKRIPFDRGNISKQFKKLKEAGLIEYEAGEALKMGKIATRFRRLTIEEIKNGKIMPMLRYEKMPSAVKLSQVIKSRFILWSGKKEKIFKAISKTGRIYTTVSSAKKEEREKNLVCNAGKDEILIEVDYKQAEPTTILTMLDYKFPFKDIYNELAKAEHISRDEAKKKLNSLNYIDGNPSKIILQWKDKSKELFFEYAQKLEQKREELWKKSKLKPRGSRTLTGYFVKANKGDKIHKGHIFNWAVQGTVSDILNIACLEIIRKEKSNAWRFLYPLHDSAFIVCKKDDTEKIKKIFENTARSKGINLQTTVKTLDP